MRRLLALLLCLWAAPALAQFNGYSGIFALNGQTFGLTSTNLSVVSGGHGYSPGDTITLYCDSLGSAVKTPATVTVATTSSGAVTSVNIATYGLYTALPSSGGPTTINGTCNFIQASTTGSGSGAIISGLLAFYGTGGSQYVGPLQSGYSSTLGLGTMANGNFNAANTWTASQIWTQPQTLAVYDDGGAVYNVKAFGAKGNTSTLYAATVTVNTSTKQLTAVGGFFTAADVGKAISVPGAGASGGLLVTTISGYTSATQVTLAAATTAVSSVVETVFYGADDTAATQSACTAAVNANGGGRVLFPPGTYFLSSQITCAFTGSSYANLGITGSGQDGSILYWPASSGIALTLASANQAFYVRGLTFATGTAASVANYTALAIFGPNTSPSTQNDVSGNTFRGIVGSLYYWGVDVNTSGEGLINYNNNWFTAPVDATPNYGVVISNSSGSNNSVYVFNEDNWSGGNIAVSIGSYTQGVTFTGCSFGGLNTGVYVPSGASGLIGNISVSSSAFVTQSSGVSINTSIQALQLSNNFMIITNAVAGVSMNSTVTWFNIEGNEFFNNVSATGQGINVGGASFGGVITGNSFSSLGTAVAFGSSTYNNVDQANAYTSTVGTPYTDAGTNNQIDVATWNTYTPAASCGGGSGTWGTVTGSYKTVGKTTYISINATLAAAASCTTNVVFTLPNTAKTVAVLTGRENQNTGLMLSGAISAGGTQVQVQSYSNAGVIASGDVYYISGVYQNQ